MANYNKSFNFRNGVQVDNDNFIVNANGLVGIGTSIPTEFLDVHGTTKVTGLITATNLTISGVSTFYSDVKIGSGITFNASTGAVRGTTFFGSAAGLTDIYAIAVDGWYVNVGNLSTTSKVGIGTTLPYYSLQIGQDPLIGNGLSIDALTGNINTTGIITSTSFVGNITGNITGNINSSGVSTFSTLQVGTGVTISGGIVRATSFVGSLSGTANTTTNIPNLTGAITSNNTTTSLGSFTSTQLATALTDETGSGANVFATSPTLITPALGNATATSLVVSAGIITASGFIGTLTGNVVGIASTAINLTPDARVSIAHIQSQSSSIGISTVSTRLYAESIGVGTNSPSSDIHIRRNSTSKLQVTSNTEKAIIAIGRSTELTGNNAAFIFGNSSGIYAYNDEKSFDIINYSTGNFNSYIQLGSAGIGTGNFNWIYGQSPNFPLMSLTYDGNLGIGITQPTNALHVVGTSTVTNDAFFGQNVNISGSLFVDELNTFGTSTFNNAAFFGQNVNISGSLFVDGSLTIDDTLTANVTGNLTGNVNAISGVSTFNTISSGSSITTNDLYVNSSASISILNITRINASVIGIGTDSILGRFQVGSEQEGNNIFLITDEKVGIGTTNPTSKLDIRGGINVTGVTTSQNGFNSGIGTAVKITTIGNKLIFTVVGVGSTSLTLY